MKNHYLLLPLAALFVIAACHDDDNHPSMKEHTRYTISNELSSLRTFAAKGEKQTIKVTAKKIVETFLGDTHQKDKDVISNAEFTVKTEGEGFSQEIKDSTITVTANENTENTVRKGTLTITIKEDNSKFIKLELTQLGQETFKETSYKISVTDNSVFQKSRVARVYTDTKELVAEICLEYIKTDNVAKEMITIYLANKNSINHCECITLADDGQIKWDTGKNACIYIRGKQQQATSCFLLPDGTITFEKPQKVNIKEAIITPYILKDVKDVEKNEYPVVKIGSQYWMAENLRTKYYADGTAIPLITKRNEWLSTTQGAITFYDNDPKNVDTCGILYNFYAVTDSRGIAPNGYRVATDKDWALLAMYLDPKNYDKDKQTGARESETIAPLLKSTDGWLDNGNGNNLSGFNAKACGSTSTSQYMEYSGKERQAYFWTSTSYEDKTAMFRRIYYNEVFLNRWFESKNSGYSVRCVKDTK